MDKRVIIAFLVLGTVACSKDLTNNQSGKIKAEFRANHPEMFSKVAGKDSWVGDGTEKIAVTLTQDEGTSTGIYSINNMSGTTESETPALWQSTKTKAKITAVYPASLVKGSMMFKGSMEIKDQSTTDLFKQCDILTATKTNVSFSNSMALDFKHAMAKVRVVLTPANGLDMTKVSSVKVNSYWYAAWDGSTLKGGSPGPVSACLETENSTKAIYEAMVLPGKVNPTKFITISMDGETSYTYNAPEKILVAGNTYTYNITVGSI